MNTAAKWHIQDAKHNENNNQNLGRPWKLIAAPNVLQKESMTILVPILILSADFLLTVEVQSTTNTEQ